MKRLICLLLAVLMLCLCSCGGGKTKTTVKTAGMLNITNSDKTYLGCRSRYNSVLTAVKEKVNVLEEQHNAEIRQKNSSDYFLQSDYILTTFEPFQCGAISLTDRFDGDMTDERAKEEYKLESAGMDIEFTSKGGSEYILRFVSEGLTKSYNAEYDKKNDAFRFIFTADEDSSGKMSEFLEFARTADGVYLIQSSKARCFVSFDSDGNIVSFCCAELDTGSYSIDESVYPDPDFMGSAAESWATARGEDACVRLHSFSDGVLVHKDRSSGELKTVEMIAADYASAFYGQ